ncbi:MULTISPECIES: AMP-binding protein [Streptomyces]|uniref:AMP-binding protein n=1 Tax=Streptomyces lienomycini TaxID=284035 RepID=A0ABV9X5R0_9ACTN|nr:AMP-binding protein [Streptomyces sp. NBC_00334]
MNQLPAHALHSRFLRGLDKAPRNVAFRVGDHRITYEEAHHRALEQAGSLLAGTDEPPAAVGVLAGKSVEAYTGVLAALYAGAAVVPLHADFPAARTRYMLEAASVGAVIADEAGLKALADAAPADAPPVLAPSAATGAGTARRLEHRPDRALAAPRSAAPSDTAFMLFTSGSTGRPKGVPVTHAATHHYFRILDQRYDFTEDDVFSQTFDLNFDCAMFDLFCAWGAGGSAHALPAHAYRDLPAFLAERRMTVWFATPSSITLARRTRALAPGAFPTLRWSLFAGEALRAEDAADWQAAAPASTLENIYGPTELTVTVTGHRWDPGTSPARCLNGLVPIGRVHEGHDHLLIDTDGEPADREGELVITGPQMTRGYLDTTDDAGRFLTHRGRTWYRTGDRVRRIDDGELVYLGRLDAQVQVQGWRVELSEIEHALRTCETVTDAVAVTRTGADGTTELVVFHTGEPTPPAALARLLGGVLPKGMLPRAYRHLAEFPLNSNRKIDRRRLAEEAALPAPSAAA